MRSSPPAPHAEHGARLDSLCDDVVQRLFATGVGIEAIVGQLDDPELARRLARHVADLDDTIEEIRSRTVNLRV
jgi:signal transduction histidine kinase